MIKSVNIFKYRFGIYKTNIGLRRTLLPKIVQGWLNHKYHFAIAWLWFGIFIEEAA